jgi:putative Holliday junction resolvase
MRYLGIDYGHKNIGLALSDEQGNFVYPYSVISNTGKVVKEIFNICKKEGVGEIVIGESLDFKGQPNPIFVASKKFTESLRLETDLKVNFHPETYSSREAARIIGDDDDLDARAAAIILESYLSMKRNSN